MVLDHTKKMTSWFMLAFSCFFLLSCVSTMGCLGCESSSVKLTKPWHLKPQESFGLVLVDIKMEPDSCVWSSPRKIPCSVDKLGLVPKIAKSVGSSIVVGHHKKDNKSYWLSAAHVCTENSRSEFGYKTKDGFIAKVQIKQYVSSVKISDYSGTTREAKVYRQDAPNDLCLLTTQDLVGKPFSVSSEDPKVGEKTFNVAAPHKIWAPGMVLMLEGYYSGKSQGSMYHYTIPARPGSSGSPILNREGKIVGVIQRAVMNFENLAISTSTQAIREILKTIPRNEPEISNPTKVEVFKL